MLLPPPVVLNVDAELTRCLFDEDNGMNVAPELDLCLFTAEDDMAATDESLCLFATDDDDDNDDEDNPGMPFGVVNRRNRSTNLRTESLLEHGPHRNRLRSTNIITAYRSDKRNRLTSSSDNSVGTTRTPASWAEANKACTRWVSVIFANVGKVDDEEDGDGEDDDVDEEEREGRSSEVDIFSMKSRGDIVVVVLVETTPPPTIAVDWLEVADEFDEFRDGEETGVDLKLLGRRGVREGDAVEDDGLVERGEDVGIADDADAAVGKLVYGLVGDAKESR